MGTVRQRCRYGTRSSERSVPEGRCQYGKRSTAESGQKRERSRRDVGVRLVMRDNPVTEVYLHRRSSPYDFVVDMSFNSRSLELYSGTSYKSALSAYWQAVNILQFTALTGRVHMDLT